MLCALALAVAASAATPVVAYNFHGVKWPDGVVPYFNAATDQSWAVATAVRAWNDSGAHVRFVAVPRSQAKLVIEDDSRKVYCSEGHASVGYARNARVVIFPAHGITHACNPYWAVRVVAHELGHVLGLVHEDRYCATMNSVGSMHGGAQCKPQVLWDWRCRLLEPDDVAGVAAVYGGQPRPPTEPELCPLYPAIGPPTGFSASDDSTGSVLTLTFTRPAEPSIPAFVAPPEWKHNASFAVSGPAPACTADAGHAAAAVLPLARRGGPAPAHHLPGAVAARVHRDLGDRRAGAAERPGEDPRRPAGPLTSSGRSFIFAAHSAEVKMATELFGRTGHRSRSARTCTTSSRADSGSASVPSTRPSRRGVDVAAGRRSHAILQAQQPAHGHGRRHDLVRRLAHRRHRPGRLAELRLGLVVPAARADRPPVRPDRGARRGRRLSHRPDRARVVLRREGAEDARGRAVQRRAARARRQRRGRDERRGVLQAPLPRRQPTARQRTGRQRRGALVDGDRPVRRLRLDRPPELLGRHAGADVGGRLGVLQRRARRDHRGQGPIRRADHACTAARRHATASPATTPASPRRSQSASARTAADRVARDAPGRGHPGCTPRQRCRTPPSPRSTCSPRQSRASPPRPSEPDRRGRAAERRADRDRRPPRGRPCRAGGARDRGRRAGDVLWYWIAIAIALAFASRCWSSSSPRRLRSRRRAAASTPPTSPSRTPSRTTTWHRQAEQLCCSANLTAAETARPSCF